MPSINVTTAATQVVPPGTRSALILQNVSDTDIFFGFDSTVTATAGANSGIRLAANGGSITITRLPEGGGGSASGGVYAVHAGTGTKELRFLPAA